MTKTQGALGVVRACLLDSPLCALERQLPELAREMLVPEDLLHGWKCGDNYDDNLGKFFSPSLLDLVNTLLIHRCGQAITFVEDERGSVVGLTIVSASDYVKL